MALISPGAPSATIKSGAPSPRAIRSLPSASQSSLGLAHPEHHRKQHALALLGESPGDQHALLGPVRADREEDRVEEQRRELDRVEVAALELLEALAQLLADALSGRLRQLPEPHLLAERLDVAHRQPAHERADHHRPQRLAAQDLRAAREQLRDERLGGLADLRDLDLELPLERLQLARAKAVAQPAPIVAQPTLISRPALIARLAKPGVELILDRALDDQPRPEPGELRQRLTRILADPHSKQPIDLLLDLRRRRYGASHGVGPPSSSCQDLREPTPCP
jgi:hypothetical protein